MKKGAVSILSLLTGTAIGAIGGVVATGKVIGGDESQQLANKHLAIMKLYDRWMQTKQEGKSITDYFHAHDIKSIAIYGMSFVGQRLYEELKNSDISVRYCIDKNATSIYSDIVIVSPEDELENVDAIIVTAIYFYNEIEEQLEAKTNIEIMSLEDILFEL